MNIVIIILVSAIYFLFTLSAIFLAVDQVRILRAYLKKAEVEEIPTKQKRWDLFILYSDVFTSFLLVIGFTLFTSIAIYCFAFM